MENLSDVVTEWKEKKDWDYFPFPFTSFNIKIHPCLLKGI